MYCPLPDHPLREPPFAVQTKMNVELRITSPGFQTKHIAKVILSAAERSLLKSGIIVLFHQQPYLISPEITTIGIYTLLYKDSCITMYKRVKIALNLPQLSSRLSSALRPSARRGLEPVILHDR